MRNMNIFHIDNIIYISTAVGRVASVTELMLLRRS